MTGILRAVSVAGSVAALGDAESTDEHGDSNGRCARLRADGAGIAQVCAQAGYRPSCARWTQALLDKGSAASASSSTTASRKGKVTGGRATATLGQHDRDDEVEDLADCDLVIEAIVENLDREAGGLRRARSGPWRPHAILASNTSSLCITELAAATKRPERFGGLHFFNPVPLMKLVEVHPRADDERRDLPTRCTRSRRRSARSRSPRPTPRLHRQSPAGAVSARRHPRVYENGLGTVEDIDNGMKLGCGYPMGPFTLLDFVGLDTTYYIANIMFEEFREPRVRAAAAPQADGAGGTTGAEIGPRLLRHTLRRHEARSHGEQTARAFCLVSPDASGLLLNSGFRGCSRGRLLELAAALPSCASCSSSRAAFGEEEVRDGALFGCSVSDARRCSSALLVAAAEQSRHLEVPAAECAIGGAIHGTPDRS